MWRWLESWPKQLGGGELGLVLLAAVVVYLVSRHRSGRTSRRRHHRSQTPPEGPTHRG